MAHVFFERNDKSSALAITKHACEAGSYDACAALGKLFRDGAWVERDAKQARRYFERACRQNEQESCAALKKMSGE
jgi:TPR repeat protein